MITKYGLYHKHYKNDDVLIVFLDDINPNREKNIGDLVVFYSENDIVRVEIHNFQKYVKIRMDGLIYLPSSDLLAIVNGYLSQVDIMLAYKSESGFEIAKENNHFVVKAKKDTLLGTFKFAKEGHICTNQDLEYENNEDEILYIDDEVNDCNVGQDFFKGEQN